MISQTVTQDVSRARVKIMGINDQNSKWGIEHFFTLASDMLAVVGYDGCFKLTNPTFENTLRYSPLELLAQPLSAFVYPDDIIVTNDAIKQLTSENPTVHFENRLRHHDGSYRRFSWTISYHDNDIFHAVIQLITEAQIIAESPFETLNNWLIDAPAGIIVLHGRDYLITLANSLYEQISGHSKEQLVGKKLIDVFPEIFEQGIGDIFSGIYETKQAFVSEEYYAAFDHTGQGFLEEGYYNFVAQPVMDSSGQVTDLFIHLYEVTDYVIARQKLQESEEQFRAIFNQSAAGNAETDLSGHFILVNDRYCEIVGYSREELHQMRLYDITHPDDLALTTELFSRMVQDGIPYLIQKRYIRKDGEIVWARNSVAPIRDANGHIRYAVAVVFDITAMKAAERALMEHQRESAIAEERQRLARELHDSATQTLFSASVLTQAIPRMLTTQPDKALAELDNLNSLIQGASSQLRTMLWELRPDRIINTTLSALLVQLASAAQAYRPIKVKLHVNGDQEQTLPAQVLMAFYHIAQESINNIIKHSQASQLGLRVRRTSNYVMLTISDDGQGFDATQGRPGFGLMIIRERADEAGAQLDIKSSRGKGSRVRLFWQGGLEGASK